MKTPEWSTDIENSPDIVIQREQLFALVELQKSLYKKHQDKELMIAAYSILSAEKRNFIDIAYKIVDPYIPKVLIPTTDIDIPSIKPSEPSPGVPPKDHKPSTGTVSFCFISSEIYGINAIETNTLRQFRDKHLEDNIFGQTVTKGYYLVSPDIVEFLNNNEHYKPFTRMILDGLVSKLKPYESH